MGTYNSTEAQFACPRCKSVERFHIDLHFGDTSELQEVALGEVYPFHERRAPHNGGPPPGGSGFGWGYTKCPACARDFHCLAEIKDQRLVGVTPDLEFPPYITDEEWQGHVECYQCGSKQTVLQTCEGFDVGWFRCEAEGCGALCRIRHDGAGTPVEFPYEQERRPGRYWR